MAKEIIVCLHCGEKTTGKYCRYCLTAEQRRQLDKENKEHFELSG